VLIGSFGSGEVHKLLFPIVTTRGTSASLPRLQVMCAYIVCSAHQQQHGMPSIAIMCFCSCYCSQNIIMNCLGVVGLRSADRDRLEAFLRRSVSFAYRDASVPSLAQSLHKRMINCLTTYCLKPRSHRPMRLNWTKLFCPVESRRAMWSLQRLNSTKLETIGEFWIFFAQSAVLLSWVVKVITSPDSSRQQKRLSVTVDDSRDPVLCAWAAWSSEICN